MKKLFFLTLLIFAAYGAVYYAFLEITDVSILKKQFPRVIFHGKDLPVEIHFQKNKPENWVSLNEISKAAMQAVLISEDAAFYQHNGYDLDQLKEAMKENLRKRRFARGGSTITQQVAKNVFLDADKNLWRKFRELILSLSLEKQVGKKRILETYFNIAEWGEGVYGIGPAARLYFKKNPAELTAKEGAFLAVLLPSPKKYSISFRQGELSPFARSTTNSILRKLYNADRISLEEYKHFLQTPFNFEKKFTPSTFDPEALEPEISDEEEDSGYSKVPVVSQ